MIPCFLPAGGLAASLVRLAVEERGRPLPALPTTLSFTRGSVQHTDGGRQTPSSGPLPWSSAKPNPGAYKLKRRPLRTHHYDTDTHTLGRSRGPARDNESVRYLHTDAKQGQLGDDLPLPLALRLSPRASCWLGTRVSHETRIRKKTQ
ncbi:unnamed protein product [Boreogadus saida]